MNFTVTFKNNEGQPIGHPKTIKAADWPHAYKALAEGQAGPAPDGLAETDIRELVPSAGGQTQAA